MKKLIALVMAMAMALSLAACGSSANTADPADTAANTSETAVEPATEANPDADKTVSGKVTTGGSTSMEKVIDILMEAFAEENPDVDVTYDPTGSGAGISGAQNATLDIGLSSRDLHDDETGVTSTTIALDGIAIVVNANNPLDDISLEEIAKIATGEITNWSELGGEDAEIVFVGREAGSGTRDGFESIVGVEDECVYSQELTATGAVIAAVESNSAAIGYASLAAVEDSVKMLTVDGVECSEATVQDGTYSIQRPFNFIVNTDAPLSDAAQAFFDFAKSDAARELISQAGAVPLA